MNIPKVWLLLPLRSCRLKDDEFLLGCIVYLDVLVIEESDRVYEVSTNVVMVYVFWYPYVV